jgi:hypothetical protein
MATKQTALNWLKEKIFELEIKIDSKTHEETFFLFEQAKQMEKEQIMEAYESGWVGSYSEQYYNETYKQQDKCSPSAHTD